MVKSNSVSITLVVVSFALLY